MLFNYASYALELNEDTLLLSDGTIKGSKGGQLIGFGFTIARDNRNSHFFTTAGEFYELRTVYYDKKLSSDFNFKEYSLDLRRYYSLSEKQSISFQYYSGIQTTGVPFQKMFQLGDFLRAYQTSRYLDRCITTLRSEYRIFPWDNKRKKRIGFVLFTEAGTVLDKFKDWRWDKKKFSYGVGTRFRLIEGEGMLLRFDFGVSKESINILFVAMEAF